MKVPVYFDTSALLKLILVEQESPDLRQHLIDHGVQIIASEVAAVELLRGARRHSLTLDAECMALLNRTVLLPLSRSVRERASGLKPVELRTIDAIHLATALEIESDLDSMVCYDRRLVDAAEAVGIETHSPGA
jgi:predicted nucleic acid-binding protein